MLRSKLKNLLMRYKIFEPSEIGKTSFTKKIILCKNKEFIDTSIKQRKCC